MMIKITRKADLSLDRCKYFPVIGLGSISCDQCQYSLTFANGPRNIIGYVNCSYTEGMKKHLEDILEDK